MKNNFKKIIVVFIFVFTLSHLVNYNVEASSLILKPSSSTLGTREQFYVDVMLDTEGKKVNGFEGSINFPSENISFLRAEEGKSMISLWVEKPNLKGNIVTFSGIIPNGFEGVIDPFNPNQKLPGLMVRLIFEAKKAGTFEISSLNSYTTLNDGLGTMDNIIPANILVTVQSISNPFIYKTESDASPEITAYVTRDPNLFKNKYALIFEARDAQTGIKEVLIKEGRRDWKKIESPYLLEDQTRHSIITLQATNYSDSSIAMSIEGIPFKLFSIMNISIAILIILILLVLFLFIIKKKNTKLFNFVKTYEKNK